MHLPRDIHNLINMSTLSPLDAPSFAIAIGHKPKPLTPKQQLWADLALALRMLRASDSGRLNVSWTGNGGADVRPKQGGTFDLRVDEIGQAWQDVSLGEVLLHLQSFPRRHWFCDLELDYPSRRTIKQAIDFQANLRPRIRTGYANLFWDNRGPLGLRRTRVYFDNQGTQMIEQTDHEPWPSSRPDVLYRSAPLLPEYVPRGAIWLRLKWSYV